MEEVERGVHLQESQVKGQAQEGVVVEGAEGVQH